MAHPAPDSSEPRRTLNDAELDELARLLLEGAAIVLEQRRAQATTSASASVPNEPT